MPGHTTNWSLMQEEGARCKASLESFTESLIARIGLSEAEAEKLRKYDRSRRNGNMYLHFPFCFLESFAAIPLEQLRVVAFSGVLWMSYMRCHDDTIDNADAPDPIVLFLRDAYLRQSLHLLYQLFPHESKFWERYSAYFDEYARAVLRESRYHSSANSPYEEEEFCAIAKGKAAMAKYPVAALAVLSGHDENLAALTESLDCFHIGYQYWDDVVDWKQDLATSKYSLLLARAWQATDLSQREGPLDRVRERIANGVYYSGLAQRNLDASYKWLQRAADLALQARCKTWADYVLKLQMQTVALSNDLQLIIARQKERSGGAELEHPAGAL